MSGYRTWTDILGTAERVAANIAKLPLSPDESISFVSRRVGEARLARKRARWFGRRLINAMTGVDQSSVETSGGVLRDILKWIGEDVPDDLVRNEIIFLPLETAIQLEQDMRNLRALQGAQA